MTYHRDHIDDDVRAQASQALTDSLCHAPLLSQSIEEFSSFDRDLLNAVSHGIALNFDQKLGHLYEDALENLITQSPDLELIASHVQIFSGQKTNRQTLGELDFLVRHKQNKQVIHLELAVKFYLAYEGEQGWYYPGPNATDHWQRKLDRMITHQLALGKTDEARELLRDDFGIETIEAQHLIYGCFFWPLMADNVPEPPCTAANKRTGRWLYKHEWPLLEAKSDMILMIPKAMWPAALKPEHGHLYKSINQAMLFDYADENCVMFTFENMEQVYFLVPDDWPNKGS